MKGVSFDNEGTCVFSSFPLDTRDVCTLTLFILVTLQEPFPSVTLQDVYTLTLFILGFLGLRSAGEGGYLPRPLVYLQTTYGMGLLLWQITMANLSLMTNGMALRLCICINQLKMKLLEHTFL